ncbi:thioesterase domain-containing protein [Streptomyces sp. NPDC047097]|uniref:thioesterase II family protein n=1 Tax=Streptomyces sp. NPDC047097 TaxID=3155260 RepID=UPI0033C7FD3E
MDISLDPSDEPAHECHVLFSEDSQPDAASRRQIEDHSKPARKSPERAPAVLRADFKARRRIFPELVPLRRRGSLMCADREDEPLRMYCFAHAGAGVSAFGGWPSALGAGVVRVPVLLPGRDVRRREKRSTDRRTLLIDLLRTVGRPPGSPYMLYGHSLGGLIAYTVARALEEAGLNPPALVAVGACPPPDAAAAIPAGAHLPDCELVALLDRLGSVPAGAPADGLWARSTLPVLRDDLRLAQALRAAADRPVRAPLLIVSGRDDPFVTPRLMSGWQRWTSSVAVRRTLPGDHFFVRGRELPRLLGRACRVVRRTTGRPPGPSPVTSPETASERIGQ